MNAAKIVMIIVVVLFCPSGAGAASTKDEMVRIDNGQLWVSAEKGSLPDALAAIAEKAGIEISGAETLSQSIRVAISGEALDAGIRRLLQGVNFVFQYDGARLSRVIVINKADMAKMPQEARVPPGAEKWVRQLTEFMETYSSPSAVLMLKQAGEDPDSIASLMSALDRLPEMGEKGQALLEEALKSQNSTISARASELLDKE